MAHVVVQLKIMPEDPEVSLDFILEEVKQAIEDFGGEFNKADEEPVAFGLKALKVFFVIDEQNSNLDPLEKAISEIKGVNSVNVEDVRRLFG